MVADAQTMKQIAVTTAGQFYYAKDFEKLFSDLQQDERLVTLSHQENRFDPLINLPTILIILLILLSTEWLLRKIFWCLLIIAKLFMNVVLVGFVSLLVVDILFCVLY